MAAWSDLNIDRIRWCCGIHDFRASEMLVKRDADLGEWLYNVIKKSGRARLLKVRVDSGF